MNWYNLTKKGISFNNPKRDIDLDSLDDQGIDNATNKQIDKLLDDMGYPKGEEGEGWSEEGEKTYSELRREDIEQAVIDNYEWISETARRLHGNRGKPTFDQMEHMIKKIIQQLIPKAHLPLIPITEMFLADHLFQYLPQIFGTTYEEILGEQEQDAIDSGSYFKKKYKDYDDYENPEDEDDEDYLNA